MKRFVLAAAIAALPSTGRAQDVAGPYVGLGLGLNALSDVTVKQRGASGSLADQKLEFGAGIRGVLIVGYAFGNGLRTELEGDIIANGAKRQGAGPNGLAQRSSKGVASSGGFVNVLYDFGRFSPLSVPLTPYAGAGVGFLSNWLGVRRGGTDTYVYRSSGGTTAAGQVILGLGFPIGAVPGMTLTTEYRGVVHGDGGVVSAASTTGPAVTGKSSGVLIDHSLLFGIRYAFSGGSR